MSKGLISLGEHDRRRREAYEVAKSHRNGIACPECGKEMIDTDPYIVLPTDPPQKRIGCECGFSGYRLA